MLSDIFTTLFYTNRGYIHIYLYLILFKGRNILHYIDGHSFCNKSPINGDVCFPPRQIFTDLRSAIRNNTREKPLDERICTFQVF